jgi:hypothetical protein
MQAIRETIVLCFASQQDWLLWLFENLDQQQRKSDAVHLSPLLSALTGKALM